MILQLEAKVHGLGDLGVLTCAYPNLSEFKATCCIPPSLPHDEICEARGVVVCSKGVVARRLIAKLVECPGKASTHSDTSLLCLRACLLCSGSPTSSTLLCCDMLDFIWLVGLIRSGGLLHIRLAYL